MGTTEIDELKEALVKQVQELKFVNEKKIENYKIIRSESGVNRFVLPWHYVDVYYAKYMFVKTYCDKESGESQFTFNFKIDADEMNRVIKVNENKEFLHFFFCNIKLPVENDLGLILRFSDTPEFITDKSYSLNGDNAYFISNGRATLLNGSVDFKEIVDEYKLKIGKTIEYDDTICNLTEYITYKMSDLLLFNEFEHELTFEAIVKEELGKLRIGLVVFVKDKDRLHHRRPIDDKHFYERYYDAGDLKP